MLFVFSSLYVAYLCCDLLEITSKCVYFDRENEAYSRIKNVTFFSLTTTPLPLNQTTRVLEQKPLQQVEGVENTHFSWRWMMLVQPRQKPRGDEAVNVPHCDTASKCWETRDKTLLAIHPQRV